MISFSTAAEAAFWIRSLSDFSVSTTMAGDTRDTVRSQEAANQRISARAAADAKARQKPNDLRAAGTGNTVDELSAQFGIVGS